MQDTETVVNGEDVSRDVSLWQDRILTAKKASEAWENESGAKRFVQEYNGKFDIYFHVNKGPINVPAVNEVFAYVQSDIAATNNRDPYITVNPRTGDVLGAKLWEVALNQEWRVLKTKEEIDLEIVDKDLVGFGWHKVGFDIDFMVDGDNLKVMKEGLYSMYVDWRDVIWNIGAKRPPKDCVWMAQRIIKPLNWVKKKFPNASGLEGVIHPDSDLVSAENATYKDDIKVVVMWEVWDADTKKIYLLADGLKDKYLSDPRPWPEYIEEFPFLMYWDYVSAGKSRPMSAIAPWEPQMHETMIILASAVNHVKRWNRQMIVKQGSISEEALDKYERGDDGAVISNTGSGNLDANVKVLDYGQLPVDFYMLIDKLNAIKTQIHGQPEFERGGVTKTGTRTVGELQLMAEGARGRVDRKIDRLETHMENIARHMMKHMKANYDVPKLVSITGDTPDEVIKALGNHFDPVTRTVVFTPAEIQGEYDVEVKAGSTLPLNKETKMKIYEIVLATLGKLPPGASSPLLNAVIGEMLDGFDITALEQAFQQEQVSDAEKQKVAKASAMAEQLKTRTQAAKNYASAEKTLDDAQIMEQKHIVEMNSPVEVGSDGM